MSGFMLHGLGDCAPERHCGCLDIPAMTAPEPTPTAKHIDAVARAISTREWGEWNDSHHPDDNRWTWDGDGRTDMERAEFRVHAKTILTSTDPAVHAAMLDALVRAGVLTERFAIRDEGGSVWLDAHGDHREAKPGGMEFADRSDAEGIVARPHEEVMRRLVTPWEVAP